MKSRH